MVLTVGASSYIDRDEPADAALQAALAAHSGDEATVFALLADVHRLSLHLEGTFPAGARALRGLRSLLLEGKLTSAENVAELAALPNPLVLDLRLQKDPLQHFAAAASRVSELRLSQRKSFANSAALAPFVALERLDLAGTAIASISPVAAMAGLAHLDLRGTKVADLGPLRGARALRFLDVHGTQVSDVTPLASLALTTLRLPTTVPSFAPLRDLRSLTSLSLRTAEGFDTLAALDQLTSLDLSFDLADAATVDLSSLPPLPRLSELTLGWATVRNLGALEALPALTSVVLSRAGCDAGQLDALRRARPGLSIHAA
jgi:Leucine-rich repeat (LRR) protein